MPPHSGRRRAPVEEVIYALAGRQHGVVSRSQLVANGVPIYAVDNWVRNGRLRLQYRGVYSVGPLRGRFEKEVAAVLACGDKAALSHSSAASLWGLLAHRGKSAPLHVSVQRRDPAPGKGVKVHRVTTLSPSERTDHGGVPITVPVRTLLDLGASVSDRELEQAVARADRNGLADRTQLVEALKRHPRRAGTRTLRAILKRQAGPAFTRSEAESRFLGLVRRSRLPHPETNQKLEGLEVDMLWRKARLIVEIDGFAFHKSRHSFEHDRQRDSALVAAGFRVMRFTWRQIADEPEATMARLVSALARAVP